MPIYEYFCQQCGHAMEALQKVSDQPLSDCPQCQASALMKQVSATAFRLKGKGWYETDFKSSSKQRNINQGDKAADSAKSADSKKGDNTPAMPSKASKASEQSTSTSSD